MLMGTLLELEGDVDHAGRDRRLPAREVGRRRSTAASRAPSKYIVPSRALAEAARNLGAARRCSKRRRWVRRPINSC